MILYSPAFRGIACGVLAVLATATPAAAQCAAPLASVQPVATVQPVTQVAYYQPTVSYQPYDGWYLGKWFDQMRIRRWSRNAQPTVATYAPAPAYTAAYAPVAAALPTTVSYAPTTVGYAPTASFAPAASMGYVAAYAPASGYATGSNYTAGYTPYLTPYAPLQRTAGYGSVVSRAVAMQPVVATQTLVSSGGCDPCSAGVGQASYSYAEPSSGCSSCAGSVSAPLYSAPTGASSGAYAGPATPMPELAPQESVPSRSQFRGGVDSNDARDDSRTEAGSERDNSDLYPQPKLEEEPASSSNEMGNYDRSRLQAPPLLAPSRDHTAASGSGRGPSVAVRHAVYRQSAEESLSGASSPIQAASQRTSAAQTQAEADASGWYSVPRSR